MLAPIYGIGIFSGLGTITDFSTLRNRCAEGVICNECIACPKDVCPRVERVDFTPAVYGVSATELLSRLDQVITNQPRITVLDTSKEPPLKKQYVQRSLIFRFPDVITVEAIPLGESKSTLAIHSYSIYGAGDLGVNANRVQTVLGELDKRMSSSTK